MSTSACVREPAQVSPHRYFSALLSSYLIRWYLIRWYQIIVRPFFDRLLITTVTSGARFVGPVIVGHAVCGHAHRRNRFPYPSLPSRSLPSRLGWCCHRLNEKTSPSYFSTIFVSSRHSFRTRPFEPHYPDARSSKRPSKTSNIGCAPQLLLLPQVAAAGRRKTAAQNPAHAPSTQLPPPRTPTF